MDYESELNALKNLLSQTDHVPNKLIEGFIETLSSATPVTILTDLAEYIKTASAEYGEVIRRRAEFRRRINELEQLIDEGTEDDGGRAARVSSISGHEKAPSGEGELVNSEK